MNKNIKIGLFGFGCVGQGLYEVLQTTPGLKAEIVKICCKDKSKPRNVDSNLITFDKNDILNNPEINVVVELISEADSAKEIVTEAIKNQKAVVSGNKKMISENLSELLLLQNQYKIPLLYEASVCASIPIIRNLEEYYDNDMLSSIQGIVNGTTNFILSKMYDENYEFENALALAQESGYAEADPTLDINGFDAKSKLQIIIAHAFGVSLDSSEIICIGITKVNQFDIKYAKSLGKKIKLKAIAIRDTENSICAIVAPSFVDQNDELFDVNNEYNGIITESTFAEKNVFIGKGAGAFPTASAVLSDISALSYDYKYEYKKMKQTKCPSASNEFISEIYLRCSSKTEVNKSLFENISEAYASAETQYVIGTISRTKLLNSGWIESDDYSVVLNKI